MNLPANSALFNIMDILGTWHHNLCSILIFVEGRKYRECGTSKYHTLMSLLVEELLKK